MAKAVPAFFFDSDVEEVETLQRFGSGQAQLKLSKQAAILLRTLTKFLVREFVQDQLFGAVVLRALDEVQWTHAIRPKEYGVTINLIFEHVAEYLCFVDHKGIQ